MAEHLMEKDIKDITNVVVAGRAAVKDSGQVEEVSRFLQGRRAVRNDKASESRPRHPRRRACDRAGPAVCSSDSLIYRGREQLRANRPIQ
jgi:hypothetical protein